MSKTDHRSEYKNKTSKSPVRKPASRRSVQPLNFAALITLILCFPAGLYAMWKNPRVPNAVKSFVTFAVVALIAAILLPGTTPPDREIGGIYLVDETPSVEIQGPEAPADRQVIEIYAPRYTSIILEPTPTPQPIIVYCNNGGAHYHAPDCKYVKKDTPNVTLQRAVEAGYTQCTECAAPSPY